MINIFTLGVYVFVALQDNLDIYMDVIIFEYYKNNISNSFIS